MFDELKIKRILNSELTEKKYSSLPDKFKSDHRIISYLINSKPELISIIPENVDVFVYVENDYSLINYLSKKQFNKCINRVDVSKLNVTKDLFDRLTPSNQIEVFKKIPNICIGYYDGVRKRELIYDIISSKVNNDESYWFYNIFTEEELQNVIFGLSVEEFSNLFGIKIIKKYIIDVLMSMNDEKLDKVLPLLNESEIFVELPNYLRNKIDIKNTNGNLELIVNLPKDVQVDYFLQNIDELAYAEHDIIIDCLMKYDKLDADFLLRYSVTFYNDLVDRLSKEEQKKIFSRNFERVYRPFDRRTYSFLNSVMYEKISEILDEEKRANLLNMYNSLSGAEVNANDSYIYHNQKYQISRLLYDDNIVNNNSVDILEQYKNTYDRNLLIKILSNAYGGHVIEIFKDRPFLDLLDIENFKVLDKKIYDKMGINFIHHLLNCNLYSLSDFIGKIALDEFVLDKFSAYFNCLIKDLKNLDLNTITNIMEKFIVYENVIKDIDFNDIDKITMDNLQLLVNDDIMFSIDVHTLDDLNNYRDIRKKRYIKIGNDMENIEDLKNLIFAYIFGRNVSDDLLLEKLSFDKALGVFNISNIIENEEIINEMNISKDEKFMLILLHEMMYKTNIDELKNVFEAVISRNLDSVLFAGTFEKIKSYYVEDIKRSLLSSSKLGLMENKIVDGVDVVTLNGDEFTAICSVTGLGLSSGGNIRRVKYGKELLVDWLNRENGFNTIATAVVSSDTSIYPIEEEVWRAINEAIVFVFGDDINIIGVGASDISSEHTKRSSVHTFEYIGTIDKDTAFSTMTELKSRINKNMVKNEKNLRGAKFNSEITITRREEDIRKENGGLKRTMPIGMYVIGEIKPYHLETAKIFNAYYEKNGLGKFKIIQVNPDMYREKVGKVSDNFEKIGDEIHGKSI